MVDYQYSYETFILWLKFNSLNHIFIIGSKVYPGLALAGMPWPAATYVHVYM